MPPEPPSVPPLPVVVAPEGVPPDPPLPLAVAAPPPPPAPLPVAVLADSWLEACCEPQCVGAADSAHIAPKPLLLNVRMAHPAAPAAALLAKP
jgi:hypothetical protein